VAEAVTPAAHGEEGAARPSGAPPARSQHAPRFALLTGALIGIAIGAVALAIVLFARGGDHGSTGWSDWRPSSHAATAAQEIANHVAPNYRLPNGAQLVTVKGGGLKIADLPAHVAERFPNGTTAILEGDAVLFTLCGDGSRCAIPGTPSAERAMLLDREGLELALYAFHYIGSDTVVELLPPSYPQPVTQAGSQPKLVRVKAQSTAMLFRRGNYAPVLSQPLDATLPPPTPSVKTIAYAPEAKLIDDVSRNAVFGVSFEQAQDASAVLLLKPLPPR
jgi:hypothetical protein